MDSSIDLSGLEPWLADALARLRPVRRTAAMRQIAALMRRRNLARIRAQENADGSAYEARKKGSQPMFRKLRNRLRMRADANSAAVGFTSRDARLARVHQFGLSSPVVPKGAKHAYPVRELLGITDDDQGEILDLLQEFATA